MGKYLCQLGLSISFGIILDIENLIKNHFHLGMSISNGILSDILLAVGRFPCIQSFVGTLAQQ